MTTLAAIAAMSTPGLASDEIRPAVRDVQAVSDWTRCPCPLRRCRGGTLSHHHDKKQPPLEEWKRACSAWFDGGSVFAPPCFFSVCAIPAGLSPAVSTAELPASELSPAGLLPRASPFLWTRVYPRTPGHALCWFCYPGWQQYKWQLRYRLSHRHPSGLAPKPPAFDELRAYSRFSQSQGSLVGRFRCRN